MASLRLPPLPSVKDIVRLYRLNALKELSQNFLLDANITTKIVKYCKILKSTEVLEVGPGPGSITRSVMRKFPKKLIVVEKDKRFKPTLDMLTDAFSGSGCKLETIYDDIRSVQLGPLFSKDKERAWEDDSPDIHIVGNLPFSISTNLIIRWLQDISLKRGAWAFGRTKMTLTFQKEVAERIVAPAYGNQRCRLSVMAQTWTRPKLNFIIPGKCFVPKPDVDVGVVTFTPLEQPFTNHEFKFFERAVRHIFCFRQKYNYKAAGTLFPPEDRMELAMKMYKVTGLDPQVRSYELSVEDVDRLVSAYKKLLEEYPGLNMYNYQASRKVLPGNQMKWIQILDIDDNYEFDYTSESILESNSANMLNM